jgi:hypothetical protein
MALFGKKKDEEEEEVVLLSDDEYDAEAELQKQILEEEEYQERMAAEEEVKGAKEERGVNLSELLLKTEKIEGKLASFEEARSRIDDRIMRVSEQVGEIRSMVLEREKSFGLLESDFEIIKDAFEDIKPSEFSKELNKKEQEILATNVRVEKLEAILNRLTEEVKEFRTLLEKIKSFENLVDVAKEVNEKISGINETKKYTERLSAKSESIFAELSKQMMNLEDYREKIEQTSELATETVRSVDEMAVKQGLLVTGEELKSSLNDLTEELNKKFAVGEKLGERIDRLSGTIEFLEKRVRIMELDKVSIEVGDKIKELSPGLKQMRRIEQLTQERKDILDLLESTEAEHRKDMSEEAYKEIKESSEKKLKEIKDIIKGDLQSLEAALEKELGPMMIAKETRAIREEAEKAPEVKVAAAKAAAPSTPKEKAAAASLEDRIDAEMAKMKGAAAPEEETEPEAPTEIEPEVEPEVIGPEAETVEEVEAEVEEVPVEEPAPEQELSAEELREIDDKLKLMETEEGTIQNLLNGLSGSTMDAKKRSLLEKKYNERLKKLATDITELKRQKESAMAAA